MGRIHVLYQGIILSLCFSVGCSAINSGGPGSWFKNRKVAENEENQDKKSKKSFIKDVDENDDSGSGEKAVAKKDDESDSKDKKDSESKEVAEKESGKTGDSSSKIQLVKHDEKTLQMIEDELKTTPPEEREKLYNDFKALDSQVVQRVIHIRQMVRQASEQSPSHQNENQNSPDSNSPQAAAIAKNQPPVTYQGNTVIQQSAGLGAASPWAKQANIPPAQNQSSNIQVSNNSTAQNYQIQPASPEQAFGHVLPEAQAQASLQPNPIQISSQNGPVNQSGVPPQQQTQPPNSVNYQQVAKPNLNPNQTLAMVPSPKMNNNPVMEQRTALNQMPANHQPNNMNQPLPQNQPPVNPQAPVMNQAQALNEPPQYPMAQQQSQIQPAINQQNNPNTINTSGNNQIPLMPQQYSVPEYQARAGFSQSSQWKNALQDLISQAEAEVARTPVGQSEIEERYYIEKHVYLRMLYLMSGQQNRALEVIPGINSKDQEFWTQIFWSLSNYFDIQNIPDKSNRATQTVAQLRTAIQRLQGHANLELKNVNFCYDIENFGNYKKYDRDEFKRGQTVLVYVEVSNLEHQFSDSKYRTELQSTIEIFKAGQKDGLAAKPIDFGSTVDTSSNVRTDYFLSYQLTIPDDLSLGPHTIKLTVKDNYGNKVSSTNLNFSVK